MHKQRGMFRMTTSKALRWPARRSNLCKVFVYGKMIRFARWNEADAQQTGQDSAAGKHLIREFSWQQVWSTVIIQR